MGLFKHRKAEIEEPEPIAEPVRRELPSPPATDELGRRDLAAQVDYLLGLVEPLPEFGMYLLEAWGASVCEEIVAQEDLPGDDTVAVDGYAVRARDVVAATPQQPVSLSVRDDGKVAHAGSAVAVHCGQRLPSGADAVVPRDRASLDGEMLGVLRAVSEGEGVRWAGSEVRGGMTLMTTGDRLDARHSALLHLAGIDRVLARPRPRVVVMGIGDGENDMDSNLLAALVKSDGGQVWRVPAVNESRRGLKDAISDQLIRADLVIITGQFGEDSPLVSVVSQLGQVDLADVRLRPGGRVGFALLGEDEIPALLLPDDPVAAYVAYQMLARPVIHRLMGATARKRHAVSCLVGAELESDPQEVDVRFATLREEAGQKVAVPLGRPGNAALRDMVAADALIVMGVGVSHLELGERTECWLLDD